MDQPFPRPAERKLDRRKIIVEDRLAARDPYRRFYLLVRLIEELTIVKTPDQGLPAGNIPGTDADHIRKILDRLLELALLHLAFAHGQVVFWLHGMDTHRRLQLPDRLIPLPLVNISAGELIIQLAVLGTQM